MLAQNRFLLLVLVGGAVLAIISLSLQFLNLIPATPIVEERPFQAGAGGVRAGGLRDGGAAAAGDGGVGAAALGKSRKRVLPPNPVLETYGYCNIPNHTEPSWEGHSPADYKLLSVHVMIRHGDRYPLYFIPKTRRPDIDCTLSTSRSPSHPLLNSFISHMEKGSQGHWESPLGSIPRVPNHSVCEMGELTQTGVVQHLENGRLLHQAYKAHNLLPPDWSPRQLWLETTGKSRTLQSGLAFLYGFLPDFDWTKVTVRHQWSTLFCGSSCNCPSRNRFLEEEQRRQYLFRVANAELERTYTNMAKTLGLLTRQLRASNPIDSLLCHVCHHLSLPCVSPADGAAGGCLTMDQFGAIRRHQMSDEVDKKRVGLYRKYAVLAMHPYLNRTVSKMEQVAKSGGAVQKEVFSLSSAHDVTMAPLLSALGLEEATFPRFAARVVFELWRGPSPQPKKKGSKAKDGGLFIRLLYNGEDVTFQTSFCGSSDRHVGPGPGPGPGPGQPLCPFSRFLSFVRKDMFSVVNNTSYQGACPKH